jgi:serine/threonine protein kinase
MQLGRFQLVREVGAGGMGVVHEAIDPSLERSVAVKVLRSARGGFQAQQRLLREARAMARLAHPNVVTVFEVGSVRGNDFVAMEFVDGENLAEWLATKPSRAAIVDAFVAAGRGLAAAHAANLVHRDFKPQNVFRTRGGRIAVGDFGLAREPALADAPSVWPRGSVTRLAAVTDTGVAFGTPGYMAPEQWEGRVTPATDQFAFCVALWEAFAGRRPFDAAHGTGPHDAVELAAAIARGPLDADRIPRRYRAILARGLHADPSMRWPSMTVLLAQLAPPKRSRSALVAIATALVLGCASALAIGALSNAGELVAIKGAG